MRGRRGASNKLKVLCLKSQLKCKGFRNNVSGLKLSRHFATEGYGPGNMDMNTYPYDPKLDYENIRWGDTKFDMMIGIESNLSV